MSQTDSKNDTVIPAPVVAPAPFRYLSQFFAFGFGSGLSPIAPGTAGTLLAIPLYYVFVSNMNFIGYSALILLSAIFGIYICGRASKQLRVHDHPGIVWDEFVGFWITMWAVPVSGLWIVAGFVVFRIYDIAKPWPIGAIDKKVEGGLGIMLDDIVAGVMACATLHLALWMLPL